MDVYRRPGIYAAHVVTVLDVFSQKVQLKRNKTKQKENHFVFETRKKTILIPRWVVCVKPFKLP